jgi:hypothetical protein
MRDLVLLLLIGAGCGSHEQTLLLQDFAGFIIAQTACMVGTSTGGLDGLRPSKIYSCWAVAATAVAATAQQGGSAEAAGYPLGAVPRTPTA